MKSQLPRLLVKFDSRLRNDFPGRRSSRTPQTLAPGTSRWILSTIVPMPSGEPDEKTTTLNIGQIDAQPRPFPPLPLGEGGAKRWVRAFAIATNRLFHKRGTAVPPNSAFTEQPAVR